MDKSALKEIEKTVEKILQEMDTELVSMEYARDHKSLVLRIFIDHENGVDMELCTRATRAVKAKIDETDLSYDQLEVSSPGLDRVLKKDKDFIRFQGHQVKIKTSKEFEGPRTIAGVLEAAYENHIQIKTEEKTYEIPRQYITSARLKPEV